MNIRKFRKANNISQQSLADFAGVSQGAVSQWESGLTNIPSPILRRLLSNDQGWDTAALLENDTPAGNSIRGNENTSVNGGNVTTVGNIGGATNSPVTVNGAGAELSRMLDELMEQNRSQREQIHSLTEIIKNLTAR